MTYEITDAGYAFLTKGNLRDRALLDMAYEFPCYLQLPCCEGGMGEPCHSNQAIHGKGGSIKAHDCFYVPGCRSCHREFDQGKTMDKEEKAALFNRAFGRFLPALIRMLTEAK